MPWAILGIENYQIRTKEIILISILFFLILDHLNGRKLIIDDSGKIYFCFILVCSFYTLIQFNNLEKLQDIFFVTHVFIFTLLNFLIYFIIFNLNLENFNFKNFINLFLIIYICIFIYFVIHSINIHTLGQLHNERINVSIGGFYTIENELIGEGKIKVYIGGPNGRSWFFLIISSFFVGYFKNEKQFIKALIPILMSLLFSYLSLSRGAVLFSFVLLILYLISFVKLTNLNRLFYFIILFSLTILIFTYSLSKSNHLNLVVEKTMSKKGFSKRDELVYESLDLITNDYFLGKGFHFTQMNKDELRIEGYRALGNHNTQNTILSIFIELGIFGVILFLSFWILIYNKISTSINRLKFSIHQSYLSGAKLMILFLFFASLFNHFLEKNFVVTPIYVMLVSMAVNIKYLIDRKLN
jgi:hypothetical protein